MAEYIVLNIGIFFKTLLNISKNLFPKNESDNHPTNVINTNDITIIEWKDAQCDADWGEIEPPELAKVVTAGFLISENKAKQIVDIKELVSSILFVSYLSRQKE